MLDMGFMPDIRALTVELGLPSKMDRQTLMFSATFPEEIQRLARELLNDYIFVTVGLVGGANTDITQTVIQVDQFSKRDKLLEIFAETSEFKYFDSFFIGALVELCVCGVMCLRRGVSKCLSYVAFGLEVSKIHDEVVVYGPRHI